jgi:hypothetical protein
MNRLATMNVTIDFALPVECLSKDDIRAMNREQREALRKIVLDDYDEYRTQFWLLDEVEDEEYYAENIKEFREYESHMNEPDFDWDFYSDWHKDMYGYRPHFRAIPTDDNERQRMCETWHRARGL